MCLFLVDTENTGELTGNENGLELFRLFPANAIPWGEEKTTQVIVNPRRWQSRAVKAAQMARADAGARDESHITTVMRAKTGLMEEITTLS